MCNVAGTFAVVCMMASKSVFAYSVSDNAGSSNLESNSTDLVVLSANNDSTGYTPLQVATGVCFVVGLWQVSIYSHFI